MPNCGVKKEFRGIKGVRSYDIKDPLFHLVVFPGAQPRRPLISTSGISVPRKFGDKNL